MFGLGTIINTAAVAGGGLLGVLFKKGIRDSLQDILMKASGLAVMFIGAAGTLQYMLYMEDGHLKVQGSMLLIFSLVIGGFLGNLINVEKRLDTLGNKLRTLFHQEGDSRFIDGFVNTTLIICIGAMAIVGSMQDGLTGDYSTLAAKAVLDFVIVMVLAASYGFGAVCSAIPIFFYQGAVTLLCHFCGAVISQQLIDRLSFVGSALIFCVGVNCSFGKKFPVGNMLLSLAFPIIAEFLPFSFF